jgi:hypothetical protein
MSLKRIKSWKDYKINELNIDTIHRAMDKMKQRGHNKRAEYVAKLATEVPYADEYKRSIFKPQDILVGKEIGSDEYGVFKIYRVEAWIGGNTKINIEDVTPDHPEYDRIQIIFDIEKTYYNRNITRREDRFKYLVEPDKFVFYNEDTKFTKRAARLIQKFIKLINPKSKYTTNIYDLPIEGYA